MADEPSTRTIIAVRRALAGVLVNPRLLEHDPSGTSFGDQQSPNLLDPLSLLFGIGSHRPGLCIAATDPAIPVAAVAEDFNRGWRIVGRLVGDVLSELDDL
jgi:hypothetical protein